jgi:hypothetical protein
VDGEIPGAIVIERNHLEWRCDPSSPARVPEAIGHQVVGDVQHHLDDLTRNGQISARGLAMVEPSVGALAGLLPQQS